ncbi:MAG TPA: DNA polymerase I, partial [Polyangiaceae bacterium]
MATELYPAGAPDVLYIVDLSSYMLRAYHALPPLSNPSGEPTNAVHGMVTMLERLLRERRPALFAIAMDSGRVTFRREIYEGYKANRPPAPDDLRSQIARCEQVVRAFRVPILKCDGVEADDLIASCVKRARELAIKVVIVAADKDLMQLVAPDVVMYDTMRERVFGVPEVEERFGVRVDQLRDVMALTGDSSDAIPGVPSIGPKTAKELLQAYGTLEGVYENLDKIARKGVREALANHRQQAFLSQRLVTLKDDCEIEFDGDTFVRKPRDIEALRELYGTLGFTRQLAQLDNEPAAPAPDTLDRLRDTAAAIAEASAIQTEYSVILELAELEAVVAQARARQKLAVETFTDLPSVVRGRLVGLSLAVEPGRAFYVPLGHRYVGAPRQLTLEGVRGLLDPLFGDASVQKVALDLKRTAVIARRAGMRFAGFGFDAALAAYLLDPEERLDREALAKRELALTAMTYEELTRRGRGRVVAFDEVSVEEALRYTGEGADFALRLEHRLAQRLNQEGLSRLYAELELPLAAVLSELELTGVRIDTSVLSAIGVECQKELDRLEQQAHAIAKKPFNVNSPRQLETLLFDEFGLKPLKRTKTSRSTDAATLEALADQHELPRVILEIRQVSKLKGTYIDALPALVDPKTQRIHTSWEQAVAATGRLSSSDPNLQNIPIRSELGRKIRAAFTAPPGHELVSADYSQIELRVLAHLSQDPVLLDAFRTGQDIHTRTAMEIFDVDEASVTREHRTKAKAVNFGVIYGQGDSGLAKALGIPRQEAASFIAAYFRRYEGVRRFMNETLERARAGE